MAVTFKAPVKDIVFGYEVVETYDVISKIPAFSDFNEDIVIPTMEECAKFAEEVLAPINAIGDQQGATIKDGKVTMPKEFIDAYKSFSEAGWASISLPSEIGGGGMPIALSGGTLEILSTANLAFGLAPGLAAGAISAINFHGSEDQKAKFLPKLVSGEWTGTMNLSEPQSGSDLGTITTKAEPLEDGSYKITGTKVWITFGEHDLTDNIIHLVLAKIPGSPEGTKGISMFIVPKVMVNDDGSLGDDNNVSCISIEEKLGIHASPTCVMEYDGSIGYLVGEENRGLNYMFTMMNEARVWVGGQGLASASGALQGAAQYARDRVQGRPVGMSKEDAKESTIIDHADVRRMLMTIKSYVDAMRYMMYDNQLMLDVEYFGEGELKEFGEERCGILTPITKAWISDLGVELSSMAIQIYGGMGYVEETGVAQYLRDSRIAPIYEGTNGIQALDLMFRKLPLDNGQAMQRLLGDVQKVIDDMKNDDEIISSMAEKLQKEVDTLSEVTLWLGGRMLEGELVDASAAATPYLKMFGQVLGGYYMGKAAILANKKFKETNDEFYSDKLTLSKFYIEQLLPLSSGYASAVTAGKEDLYAMKAENF
ncbi:acyl-CoA dehydrogenase C-terminal domain-containing protein [Acidimicrobiaceae bacterium]|nr:acyl-CoA dehydrogenase C-terminal domain-containing protein [Acidimicrobiaceae bacterium]